MTTTLVYDGDCAFCTSAVNAMVKARITADVVVPWQRADLGALGLTEAAVPRRGPAGRAGPDQLRAPGVRPAAAAGGAGPGGRSAALLLLPPFSWLAAGLYRLIANNRSRLPGGTPACAVPPPEQP